MATEISVPDIGDFESVEIIEILVKPGDTIKKNDPVVTLESDKSSVEVPSPFAGKISALKVKIGDKVSTGSVLALIEDEKAKVEQQSSEQEKEKTKPLVLKEDDVLPETEKIIKEAESTIPQTSLESSTVQPIQIDEITKVDELKVDKEETAEDKLVIVQDKLLRTMAEMENQRRRFEKEKQEAFEFGGFNFAGESLSLLDNIDRAIMSFRNDENLKNNKDLNKIIDGIEVVKKDLVSIFKKNGIESIECINKKFDPNFHQAMLEVEDNTKEPGTVVQEIQKGYMMKDRLLRPSLVSVTKKREEKLEKTTNDDKKTDKKSEKKWLFCL